MGISPHPILCYPRGIKNTIKTIDLKCMHGGKEPSVTNKVIRVRLQRFARKLAFCSFVVKLVSLVTYRQ